MSENINENVSVNKERENHREYNKTRKYNSRNRKPGDNNTKKPMGKQKISVINSRKRIADIMRNILTDRK